MAKGKAKKATTTPVRPLVLLLEVYADGDSFLPEVTSDLSPEIAEAILRQTADVIGGKNDRAAGAWGRP